MLNISKFNSSYIKSNSFFYLYSFFYFLHSKNFCSNINFFFNLVGKVLICKFLDISLDELKIKFFIGICIAQKNDIFFKSVHLRNVVKKEGIENIFHFFSPIILDINYLVKYKKKYRLSKLYFLSFKNKKFY